MVTRTPEPLLAAVEVLGVGADRAVLTGWKEQAHQPGEGQVTDLDSAALRAMNILAGPDLAHGPVRVSEELGEATGGGHGDEIAEYTLTARDVVYRSRARVVEAGGVSVLYLVCSVEMRHPRALMEMRKRVQSALNTLGRAAVQREPVYVTVFARIPEVLDAAQQRAASQKIAARLRGRQVHEHAGESLYSLLSHTMMLGPSVPVAGRSVNLSVVLRPDREGGCTWLVLGSPLCAGDY
jgi:hypothetical protein